MTDFLIDSNVILDILTADAQWLEWSTSTLTQCAEQGDLVINPIIYAEISTDFDDISLLDLALPSEFYRRDPLPYEAGFLAGQAFLAYRRRGGERRCLWLGEANAVARFLHWGTRCRCKPAFGDEGCESLSHLFSTGNFDYARLMQL